MVRRITPAAYRRMPWRNGGGTTTEIVVEPSEPSTRFLHRLSIADVTGDGPFSIFEGYDRHIMLLSGRGMILHRGAYGSIELTRALEPHAFSGDWAIHGKLVDGPVRDFNWIVDRSRAQSSLVVRRSSAKEELVVSPGSTCLIYVLEGALMNASTEDTLVADESFELVPVSEACVAIARVAPYSVVTPREARPEHLS